MTISSTTRKAGPFVGNGVTTEFPFDFKLFATSDLRVVRADALGVETDLAHVTDCTVTLNADQDENPGGSVVLNAPLADGFRLVLLSAVPELQPVDLTNQGGFYPELVNGGLDRATVQVQQLREQMDRSITVPVTSEPGDLALPSPSPGQLLGWTDSGLTNYDPSELVSVVTYGDTRVDLLSGDGVTTTFALSASPGVQNNLRVSIAGVVQVPGVDFTWGGGTVLTFIAAPPAGTSIMVQYQEALLDFGGANADLSNVNPGVGRDALGLGDAATRDVGTAAGEVAAGDDSRILGAAQSALLAASGGSSLIGWTQADYDAIERTVQAKLWETVSVTDFGAVGDGSTDDTDAFAAAIVAVYARGGGPVMVPPGDYKISASLTLPGKVTLVGAGAGRVFQPVQPAATTISWYGGANAMLKLGHQAGTVAGGGVVGIRLVGRALATQCLWVKDAQHPVVDGVVLTGSLSAALYLNNTPGLDPTGFGILSDIQISLRGGATDNAHGIFIDGTGTGVDGVTLCSWRNIRIEHANGDGVRVGERGDGMSWYNLYTFRAGAETGFGVHSTASASGVVSAWSFYNALPNGGVQIDTANTAKGWVFDSIQDIDVDPSAQGLIYGAGASDVSVMTTASTRKKGPAKIDGFRNPALSDAMMFRRWDSTNNILHTADANYFTGGAYGGASVYSAGQPGGAVAVQTGNVSGNALYFSAVGEFTSGLSISYEPQMAVTWTPTSTVSFVARVGFVGSYAATPDNGVYVEADPTASGFYRCVTRNGGAQTATVSALALGIAIVQWRIEVSPQFARFFYRTGGNNLWALAAVHSTNLPSAPLVDVVYARNTASAEKSLSVYDYRLAWDLEA